MSIEFTCPKCRGNLAVAEDGAIVCPCCRRSAWLWVQRGLIVEMSAVCAALVVLLAAVPLACCISWSGWIIPRGDRQAEYAEMVAVATTGVIVWVLSVFAARSICALAPPLAARAAAWSSAFVFLCVFALGIKRTLDDDLLPGAAGTLLLIAGVALSELLFVLYLRAVALRFGRTALAHQVILYFTAAAALPAAVYVGSVTLEVMGGPAGGGAGSGWWVALLLLVWRFRVVRSVNELIDGEVQRGPL